MSLIRLLTTIATLTDQHTAYSPLVRLGAGPGKKVAIVGLGGLGHFAVLWAVALGAEVYVLSHSPSKKADALKMGAKEFVVTGEQDWHKKFAFQFDFILNTADAIHKFNMPDYLSTLKVMGRFHCVGFGDHPLPTMNAQDFAPNGSYFGASHIGNRYAFNSENVFYTHLLTFSLYRPEMFAMLELAAKQNIKSWIQTIPISEKGCAEAVKNVSDNNVKYRYVLTDYDKIFGDRS